MIKMKIFCIMLFFSLTVVDALTYGFEFKNSYFQNMEAVPILKTDIKKEDIQKKKNIIFILVDALRPDHLTPYGYQRNTSPHLKKFADDSLVFTNFYANAPWTRPSTASFLTGLLPSKHGVETRLLSLSREQLTLAEHLKKNGYTTLAVIANGNASSIAGLDQGFDFYADSKTMKKSLPSAKDVFAIAQKWLETQQDTPFFLFLFLIDVHDPYHAPKGFENYFLPDYQGTILRTPHWEYNNQYPIPVREKMLSLYDDAIRYTDFEIGSFFQFLKEKHQYDNSHIFISADHGEGFGEHGKYLHAHHFYNEMIRIPLMIKLAFAQRVSGTTHQLADSIDLFSSISMLERNDSFLSSEYARPLWCDIHPLSAILSSETMKFCQKQKIVISEYHEYGIDRQAILNDEFKIVYQYPADEKEFFSHIPEKKLLPSVNFTHEVVEVFDRKNDVFEKNDLSKNIPKQVQSLLKLLKDYHQAMKLHSSKKIADEVSSDTPEAIQQNLRSLGYVQ